MSPRLFRLLIFAAGLLFAAAAQAGCPNPNASGGESPEGAVVYNAAHKTMQFCDGTTWWAMKNGGGLPSCAEGDGIIMTASGWDCGSSGGGGGPGYFVLTQSTWTGNLGGMSGADSKCLDELQTQNWRGKTDAQSRDLLVASKVKAFICGKATCNNLQPATPYFFARAGSTTAGGMGFITDTNGAGPAFNDGASFWDIAGTFETGVYWWSNRASGTATAWGTTPYSSANSPSCDDWTNDINMSYQGRQGNTIESGVKRWNDSSDYCDGYGGQYPLVCFVNP